MLLHDHIVQRERLGHLTAGAHQARGEQRALIHGELAAQRLVDGGEHVLGHDVGEEADAAAVDPEERHAVARYQARRVQERAVPADRDDEVGARAELLLSDAGHGSASEGGVRLHQHRDAGGGEVRHQGGHALGHARIGESAH